jgi:hypothetical protein
MNAAWARDFALSSVISWPCDKPQMCHWESFVGEDTELMRCLNSPSLTAGTCITTLNVADYSRPNLGHNSIVSHDYSATTLHCCVRCVFSDPLLNTQNPFADILQSACPWPLAHMWCWCHTFDWNSFNRHLSVSTMATKRKSQNLCADFLFLETIRCTSVAPEVNSNRTHTTVQQIAKTAISQTGICPHHKFGSLRGHIN